MMWPATATTTATVLAQALVHEGLRAVASGANPIALKRGIEKATEAIAAELKRLSRDVETTADMANVGHHLGSRRADRHPDRGRVRQGRQRTV